MKDELAKHVRTGKKIRVTRRQPSDHHLHGYVLGLSDELVLMHSFGDFWPEGYTVFRRDDVVRIRCGPHDQWWDHMLQSEGLLSGLDLTYEIDLSSMVAAIRSIDRHYDQLIIEREKYDREVGVFCIGECSEVDDRTVRLRTYDEMGYWEADAEEMDVERITKVQFDTPYIHTFSKYTREGPNPCKASDDA